MNDALRKIAESAAKGNEGILDLDFGGKSIRENDEYKKQKVIADKIYSKLSYIYSGSGEDPIIKMMEFNENDYVLTLYQGTLTASKFNQMSAGMDIHLKAWFVLGYYASVYELACKCITSIAKNLSATPATLSCGDARTVLKDKHGLPEIANYFDNFLRNAIDHTQYIITDLAKGEIDAWNTDPRTGVKTTKKQYALMDVFQDTLSLLFMIIAIFVKGNEEIVERSRAMI